MPTPERKIEVLDLSAERACLGSALDEAVLRVLHSGRYVSGPEAVQLEESFAALCRVKHAVAVASGTDALILGLRALGVRPGDHVVTTPFTFFASAAAIAWVGAIPRLADVELETALLDPAKAAHAIDERTSCLLPVHLYGQMADMRALRALADERGVRLLEDGAQAHGAHRQGVSCGELGDACTFSFYPTKNLGAAGEAGLVVTRVDDVAARLKRLRDHGSRQKYVHDSIGTNARMDEIQAAVLNVKLPHLERWNTRRKELAARYNAAFDGSETVRPIRRAPDSDSVYHQYAVRVTDGVRRDWVLGGLKDLGILTGVHYPRPVHLQKAARDWGYGPGDFPAAEQLAQEILCLPIHPFLQDEDIERVAAAMLALTGS